MRCDRASDDTEATADHSRRTNSSDRSTNNQGIAVARKATDKATCLEDDNACQEDCLQVEVFVELAPEGLSGRNSEEERRAVPANIFEAVQLFCDLWDRSRDDGQVE